MPRRDRRAPSKLSRRQERYDAALETNATRAQGGLNVNDLRLLVERAGGPALPRRAAMIAFLRRRSRRLRRTASGTVTRRASASACERRVAAAVREVQKQVVSLQRRLVANDILQPTHVRYMDQQTGAFYYVNITTGASTWARPSRSSLIAINSDAVREVDV